MSEREKKSWLDWWSRRLNVAEIFSLLTSYGLFYAELDGRKPFREALAEALEKPAPSYGRWPRVLGLVVVVLLGLEIVTGGLLALYYLPTPQAAHASVGSILRDVQFGRLIHQVHFWGAQALIALLVLRLARFFVQRLYRAPRELVWVFGALLLLVCLHSDLTGRFLPWTDSAYWSSVRALEIVGAVPLYGSVVHFLIGGGGALVSELTLIRFYVLHVAVLPMLAVALVYLHFSTVRRVGLSEVGDEASLRGRDALRDHLVNLGIVLAMLFGLLGSLAVLAPESFGGAADPWSTVPGARPPWYLLAPFGLLELTSGFVPRPLAGALLFLVFTAFVALPFLHRPAGGERRRILSVAIAAGAVLAWVLLTLYGARVA